MNELDAPVKIALLGAGNWGPNLARNLRDLPQASLELICHRGSERLAEISQRFPDVSTTTDYRDVLADPDLEAVVIATQVGTHAELATAALDAGKHVLVEKPLTASLGEAEALVRLAGESGRVLMPGHTFLYSPPVNVAREVIHSGELGEIQFVSASRVNLGLHQPDVSVVWDLGPHDFSILRYWLEEMPCRVSALSRDCVIENLADVVFVNLEFPSGTLAHVELSWLAPTKVRRTTVVGSQKMLVYDDTSDVSVRVYDSRAMAHDPAGGGGRRVSYHTGDVESPPVADTEPLSLELSDFCLAIRRGGRPRSSAELGLDVVRVCEAVTQSLAEHGAPVEIPAAGQRPYLGHVSDPTRSF